MKQSEDNIPILFAAVVAVLCLLAVLVMLAPSFFPYERNNYEYEFVNKGDLIIGKTFRGQFTYSSIDCSCAEAHVYSFRAQENQLIIFSMELESLYSMDICIAETPTSEDCSLSHHGVYEDEGSLEFDMLMPHDGQYYVILRAGGNTGAYQIGMELAPE